jgi:hypothetical protein
MSPDSRVLTRPDAMSTMGREQFKALVGNRKIFIFSVNLEGVGFLRRFTRMGLDVGGFIDSRPFKDGKQRGKPVISPDEFFAGENRDVFVLITAKHRQTRKWAIDLCESAGLAKGTGYMYSTMLCDYFPTIEVAGVCNLRCISCNMGQPDANRGKGVMSAERYRQVLEKMSQEIPFLNSVYLYLWGEPLLNKELPEIVRITRELGAASEISSNLVDGARLEALIEAQPDVLVAPCSGVGENFGLARTGGTWDEYRDNLYKLREYLDRHNAETVVRITYHMYKHNLEKDYDTVEKIAKELGYQFLPVLAQIFPEKVLRNVINGEAIPEEMLRANEMLYFPIHEQLAYAQSVKDRNCFMMKVFPSIRWDGSVVHCSNLMNPVLTRNYLDISLDDLLDQRGANGFCNSCMDHGMHRFFDVSASVTVKNGRRVPQRS